MIQFVLLPIAFALPSLLACCSQHERRRGRKWIMHLLRISFATFNFISGKLNSWTVPASNVLIHRMSSDLRILTAELPLCRWSELCSMILISFWGPFLLYLSMSFLSVYFLFLLLLFTLDIFKHQTVFAILGHRAELANQWHFIQFSDHLFSRKSWGTPARPGATRCSRGPFWEITCSCSSASVHCRPPQSVEYWTDIELIECESFSQSA